MSKQAYAGLLERLVELQAILASDEQSNRYLARQELAGLLPRINEAISSLLKRVGELEGLAYHAEQAWTYIAQSTATEQQLTSARFHINKMRDAFAALNSDAPLSIGEGL